MRMGTFLPLIVPPTIYQAGLWSTWLTVLCSLKMFQALARDRLERLNASPSATPWTYLRVYSALLFVFMADVFWIRLCLTIYRTHRSSMYLLLFFEPFSIAFETLQAILVHGFQLLDIWLHHSACNSSDFRTPKLLNTLTAGSLLEWKGILIRNLGFFLDMATFFMALGHYLYIWRLHGMAFHLVDAVLFLNIRALLSAIVNRIKGFIKLRIALGTLHAALPDATTEELRAYDDECAICREPMAKAKKLNCNHLLYLACLRSWLDQGLTDIYTCPTCRKPLFEGVPQNEASSDAGTISSDQQLARQISAGLDRPNPSRHTMPTGLYPNQTLNTPEGLDSGWLHFTFAFFFFFFNQAMIDTTFLEHPISEDTLQLLFQASNSSNLEKSLEILIQNAKSDSGRLELASKRILPAVLNIVQSLAQASHHHHHNQTFSLCFKLLRNLCAGEAANQVSFIELNGVAVVWSVLRSEAGSLGPDHRLVRWGLQVLANVSLGGNNINVLFGKNFILLGLLHLLDDDGWPVVAEIVRTASSGLHFVGHCFCCGCKHVASILFLFFLCCHECHMGIVMFFSCKIDLFPYQFVSPEPASFDEDWLKLLLSRIFLEESQLPVLFSKLQSVDVPEGEVIESKNGQFSFEQAFLLEILSEILNERLGDVTVSKDVVLFVFGIFKKSIGVLEHAMRGKSGLPSGFTGVDVLGYSLTILRDICAQDGMRGNTKDVVDVLLSYGLIEFLLSLLGALEPPAISRKGLKQIENQDNASCCSKPCPYKGFRRDIVALIGNCVYRRKHAQDEIRDRNGILLLLQQCVPDEDNPFLREWGLWSARNMLLGNDENQKLVAELEIQGCADVPELIALGLQVEVDQRTRRPKLVNIPSCEKSL
ncbi:hypothetical protein ACSQ67_009688 [Phaseolus vulgaris]